jgi:hypothetical protein
MADAPAKKLISHEPAVVIGEILLIAILLTAIVGFISNLITKLEHQGIWVAIANTFRELWPFLQILAALSSALFVVGIIFLNWKLSKIREAERKILNITKPKGVDEVVAEVPQKNERWEAIEEHMASENQNDWRQAIIDADIMLDEMLTRMGYSGATIGDKLKLIEKSDFQTIDEAWEAHKVRNRIAHEGGEFLLNQREARRVVDLYRQVFEEFKLI